MGGLPPNEWLRCLRGQCAKKVENTSIDQSHDFFHFPSVVGQARFHRRGDAERLVDASEVVVHEVEGDRVLVVLDLL
jgi:hypothetical protein